MSHSLWSSAGAVSQADPLTDELATVTADVVHDEDENEGNADWDAGCSSALALIADPAAGDTIVRDEEVDEAGQKGMDEAAEVDAADEALRELLPDDFLPPDVD